MKKNITKFFLFITGLILRQFDLSDDVVSILAYPGEIFLRALKLIILPFIICCVIIGKLEKKMY